ncbi:MAG: CDP-alcohol phosphatidyltransferase family protein [Candidatus Lokiarchaeota archaeon]
MEENQYPNKKRAIERKIVKKFIETPTNFLISHHITPNILSYLGFLCSVAAAFFIAIGTVHYPIWLAWPAPFLIFMSGTFDVFDGEVARKLNKESSLGAFLDSNLDRLSDAILIIGLIYGGLINYFIGYILLFVVIMISYTRSRAEAEGINMKGIGLMERGERMLTLILGLILETWIFVLTSFTLFFSFFIIIYLILLLYTLSQRIVYTYKELKI